LPGSPARNRRRVARTAALALTVVALASCNSKNQANPPTTSGPASSGATTEATTPAGTSGQTTTTGPPAPSLLPEAAAAVPAGAGDLIFTNWHAIQDAEGVHGPSGDVPADARIEFFSKLRSEQFPVGTALTIDQESLLANFGFTSTDLRWEASSFVPGVQELGGFELFAFDPEFDMASFGPKFEACSFEAHALGSATEYSTDRGNSCLSATGPVPIPVLPDQANTVAVVPDRHLLVIAALAPAIEKEVRFLAGSAPTLADDPGFASFLESLGPVDSAYLIPLGTAKACNQLDFGVVPQSAFSDPPALKDFLQREAPFIGRRYRWLALGERYEADPRDGVIGFLYPDASSAQLDLPLRSRADEIPSFQQDRAYGDFAFRRTDVKAAGPVIDVLVGPVADEPLNLLSLGPSQDLVFALCTNAPGS
jgi:hypothetical protein